MKLTLLWLNSSIQLERRKKPFGFCVSLNLVQFWREKWCPKQKYETCLDNKKLIQNELSRQTLIKRKLSVEIHESWTRVKPCSSLRGLSRQKVVPHIGKKNFKSWQFLFSSFVSAPKGGLWTGGGRGSEWNNCRKRSVNTK